MLETNDTVLYCIALYCIVLYLSTDRDNALTESRLEEHDKRFGSPLTMRQLLGEDIMSVSPTDMHSVNTGDGIVGNRYQKNVYRGPGRKGGFLGPIPASSVRSHLKKQSRSQTQAVGTGLQVIRIITPV